MRLTSLKRQPQSPREGLGTPSVPVSNSGLRQARYHQLQMLLLSIQSCQYDVRLLSHAIHSSMATIAHGCLALQMQPCHCLLCISSLPSVRSSAIKCGQMQPSTNLHCCLMPLYMGQSQICMTAAYFFCQSRRSSSPVVDIPLCHVPKGPTEHDTGCIMKPLDLVNADQRRVSIR